jgi:hypothetical protein
MTRKKKSRKNAAVLDLPLQGVYVQELVDAASGHAKRLRRIDDHPLTLAYERGRLAWPGVHTASDRYAAANRFREAFETLLRTGRDSSEMIGGGCGGGPRDGFSDTQEYAGRTIARTKAALKPKDYIIVQRLCGEGWSMAEAVKQAVPTHPNAVTARVCEALDELVDAMSGRAARAAA